jgi:hypothetical protein
MLGHPLHGYPRKFVLRPSLTGLGTRLVSDACSRIIRPIALRFEAPPNPKARQVRMAGSDGIWRPACRWRRDPPKPSSYPPTRPEGHLDSIL